MASRSRSKPVQPEPNTGNNIAPAVSTTAAKKTTKSKVSTASKASKPATVTTPAPRVTPPTPAVNPPAPAPGPGIVKPPPTVTIPSPPAGFVPANPKDYRGFRPKSSEIAAVPDSVVELQNFTNYNVVFGSTAPAVGDLAQGLDASLLWTSLLADSSDWMAYVKSQEGMAWMVTLTLVDKLKAPFALASANDPTLAARYPALARLLGAAKVIAKRGAATKARTKAAAAGKPSTTKAKKAAAAKAAANTPAAPAAPVAAATPAVPAPTAQPAGGAGPTTHG